MLSAKDLAYVQRTIEAAFDTPATFAHATLANGSFAITTSTYGAPYASCLTLWDVPSAPVLAEYASHIGAQQLWQVSLPQSVAVAEGDQLTLTSTGEGYMVHALLRPQSYSPFTTILVGRISGQIG